MAKLSFTAILFWLPGWSLSSKVVQGPPAHLSRPEASVEFNCSHSISNYDTILWYQKLPGGIALTLIGFIYYQTKEVEVGYQDRFDLKGNGEKAVSLHISNMTAGDTAVYLCRFPSLAWCSALDMLGVLLLLCVAACCSRSGTFSPSTVNMLMFVIPFALIFLSLTGRSEGDDVTQTPSVIWVSLGENATMNCSHKKGPLQTPQKHGDRNPSPHVILTQHVFFVQSDRYFPLRSDVTVVKRSRTGNITPDLG
ncbi:hypothetical protein GN956_G5627 [Arapaima gigas]